MAAPDTFLYEYAVVRFVPRVDREEFVNIGLIMMCKRQKWLECRIMVDETKVKALDSLCQPEMLRRQASFFMRKDVPSHDLPVEERFRWLTAVKSAILQVSSSHPGIIAVKGEWDDDSQKGRLLLEKEFERLFESLVL